MVSSGENVIESTGLTKVFKDFWLRDKVTAVADLNLEVHPHEVFGLLGPNGSGKSTTLKMILGLLYPTRGRVEVLGRLPTDVRVKQRIGFLPEESYLYPFLDAWETLDFYGRLFHQPRRERRRRIEMLLEMVGLTRVAYRRIGEYSKGMQRRIGLAQALINDPDLLIVDEPTSGMDPIGTRQFKDLIVTLASRGKTVLLSSHLLADVEDVCDRVCILYGGRQRAMGPVADLLRQQDQTQITTARLDEATLDRIRQLLAEAGQDNVEVTHPRSKLETLFLDIVTEAQRQRLATGGVTDTGGVAAFLRSDEPEPAGEAVIEKLVGAARAEEDTPAEEPAPAAPAPVTPSHDVLDTLLRSGADAPDGNRENQGEDQSEEASKSADKSPPAATDRGIIDSLVQNAEDSSGDA